MSDIYKGVALPWKNTLQSFIDPKNDEDVLKSSVLWIVLTRPGERLCQPEFGCNLYEAIFEPGDDISIAQVKNDILSALRRWETRITVLSCDVVVEEHILYVKLQYRNNLDPNRESVQMMEFEVTPSMLN